MVDIVESIAALLSTHTLYKIGQLSIEDCRQSIIVFQRTSKGITKDEPPSCLYLAAGK